MYSKRKLVITIATAAIILMTAVLFLVLQLNLQTADPATAPVTQEVTEEAVEPEGVPVAELEMKLEALEVDQEEATTTFEQLQNRLNELNEME